MNVVATAVTRCALDQWILNGCDFVADAIDALTRRDEEEYLNEYIPRVAQNPFALSIKLYDIEDNLSHTAHGTALEKRYLKAREILEKKYKEFIALP